jgi:hypothetical protein
VESKWKNYHIITFLGQSLSKTLEEAMDLSEDRLILELYLSTKVAGQKHEIIDSGNPLRRPRDTLYPQKLALTSPTSGGRSVGIVRSRIKATE